jgi:hypothetical protein
VAGRITFSGHETFPLRYTWLAKGVRASSLLDSDQAMAELGVGKNMVRAIKYWCTVGELLKESKDGSLVPTALGEKLFGLQGVDPCFEDPATLWLMHWQLASRIEGASISYLMLNHWRGETFTKELALAWVLGWVKQTQGMRATENTLKRDLDVFVRSYAPTSAFKAKSLEDTLDCPLSELGLLQARTVGEFAFIRGAKPSLPVEIFGFALEHFWLTEGIANRQTLSFEEIVYSPGSPGQVFKLDEASITYYLESLEDLTGGAYIFDTTAGLRQVLRKYPSEPLSFIEIHY